MSDTFSVSSSKGTERGVSTLFFFNKHLLVLTILVLAVGGLSSLANLPRLEDPRITTRNATILTFLQGASASRIEALINKKIEDSLQEIDAIKLIESTARPSLSTVKIELKDSVTNDTNEEIFAKIRSRLQTVKAELPAGATAPVLDSNRGVTAYSLILGVKWTGSAEPPLNLMNRIALSLKDHMQQVGNTELVRVFGGVEEEITVIPDKAEIAALNISTVQLLNAIAQADSKISAGQLRGDKNTLLVEVDDALNSASRIARVPVITNKSGSVVRVGDFASVNRGYTDPPTQLGLKDGQRIIYVGVRADENIRIDRWTANALAVFDTFKAEYSDQIQLEVIFEQNVYTQVRLSDLASNLILGCIVVFAVVLLTMGWKSALVVSSILPLAAAGTLFAFSIVGQSIHQISIFGLIVAIGLLIDSAIVMTDEIRKSASLGFSKSQAVRKSVRHLLIPLFASTVTTILGFMPIVLLPGSAGDFVSPIAISLILALCFSFFLAITVIPALAAAAIDKSESIPESGRTWLANGLQSPRLFDDFRRFTIHAMQQPVRYLALAAAPCVIGFALVSTMKSEFFPPADRDMFEIKMYLPPNSSIQHTQQQVLIADEYIKAVDGVTGVHWLLGASTPMVFYNSVPTEDQNSSFAHAIVQALDQVAAERALLKVQASLTKNLPEAVAIVKRFSQGSPVEAPVEFLVTGAKLDTLRELGEKIRAIMHENPDIVQTRASISGGQPKIWFQPDEMEANLAGLSLANIAEQFASSLEGNIGGSVLEGLEELPVRVRFSDADRSNLQELAALPLASSEFSRWVPAAALGEFEIRPEVAEITRYDGQRVNTLSAYIQPNAKAVSVSQAVAKRIAESIEIPAGCSIVVAGDSEQQNNAVGGLAVYAPVLIILMVATIILAFRSVVLATIIFSVALLAVGLGMLSLKISGYPFGFLPIIGSIGLAGIVINDSIVILAAILGNERARLGDSVAIVDETYGCGRHVLSTTFTTIGGFLPLMIFSGGSLWPPLTSVIAGGIGFGLMLAMFFTPLAYKLYANIAYGKQTDVIAIGITERATL